MNASTPDVQVNPTQRYFAIVVVRIGELVRWRDTSTAGRYVYLGILRQRHCHAYHSSSFPLHVQLLEPSGARRAALCVNPQYRATHPGLIPISPYEIIGARGATAPVPFIYVEI